MRQVQAWSKEDPHYSETLPQPEQTLQRHQHWRKEVKSDTIQGSVLNRTWLWLGLKMRRENDMNNISKVKER